MTAGEGFSRMTSMVINYMTSRLGWLNRLIGGDNRRSIEDECGHRKVFPVAEEYHLIYQRDPIAARVVEVFPKESWQVQPRVYEDEDPETETPFERAWRDLGGALQPEQGYYQDERGGAIWEALKRVDELCGIGRYGVLFLGLDDNQELQNPVDPNRQNKLLFLTPLSEVHCRIVDWDRNMGSSRFGRPILYQLTFADPQAVPDTLGAPMSGMTVRVHWSRVIHVIDNPMESVVFGIPRMQQVIDRIDDLRKLYGGSAEMYWKGAFPGLAFEGHPNVGAADMDLKGLQDMAEDYQNGLQRLIAVLNMTVKSLSPQVKDPTPQIDRQIEAICIKLGCPKRIFTGSERGELASTQDDAQWNDRLRERQHGHCTPRIIVPFVTRLINIKALPRPNGFSVSWPDLTNQTPEERATVSFKSTQAIAQFITGDGRTMMTDLDFLTAILGMDESLALAITENRKAAPILATQLNAQASRSTHVSTNPAGPSNGQNPTQTN